MSKYNKLIVALVGAVVAGLYAYYGADSELVQTVIGVATALGVYQVPNQD